MKCENDNEEKGSIALEKTDVSIVSSGDGIYASSSIYAYDVTATITAGGGAAAAEPKNSGEKRPGMAEIEQETDESTSTKGVKAGVDLIIDSGSYTIDSADDAIHSDGDLGINGGNFTISTGDDAVHADFNVDVSPENMNITCCYEGIEGEYVIINGGSISIISNDDAINATGENSANGFGGGPGMMGSESKTAEEDIYLTINDGDIYIETSGDGIDSNGSAVVNGGRIEIYGPEDSGNGSIDVGDGGYVFIMNGGSLIAAGSSGMAECPYSGSEQNVLVFYLETACEAGSFVSVTDSAGNEVISGTVNKSFDFICVSDSAIIQGETYTLYINGTETASLEASETVSVSGTAAGGMSRGGMGRRQQQ